MESRALVTYAVSAARARTWTHIEDCAFVLDFVSVVCEECVPWVVRSDSE